MSSSVSCAEHESSRSNADSQLPTTSKTDAIYRLLVASERSAPLLPPFPCARAQVRRFLPLRSRRYSSSSSSRDCTRSRSAMAPGELPLAASARQGVIDVARKLRAAAAAATCPLASHVSHRSKPTEYKHVAVRRMPHSRRRHLCTLVIQPLVIVPPRYLSLVRPRLLQPPAS